MTGHPEIPRIEQVWNIVPHLAEREVAMFLLMELKVGRRVGRRLFAGVIIRMIMHFSNFLLFLVRCFSCMFTLLMMTTNDGRGATVKLAKTFTMF